MVVKHRRKYEPRKAGGANLRESVWERVELMAQVENMSLSQVMDTILDEHLLSADELRNLLPQSEDSGIGLSFAPLVQGEDVPNEPNSNATKPDGGTDDAS